MELVKPEQMTIPAAAKELKDRYRQGRRLSAAYTAGGLSTGMGGNPSNRKTAEAMREPALMAYREGYGDFGPTCAAEGIRIRADTLRDG